MKFTLILFIVLYILFSFIALARAELIMVESWGLDTQGYPMGIYKNTEDGKYYAMCSTAAVEIKGYEEAKNEKDTTNRNNSM